MYMWLRIQTDEIQDEDFWMMVSAHIENMQFEMCMQ